MDVTPEVRRAAVRAAAAIRRGRPSEDAKRELNEAKLIEFVERVLGSAPPLSQTQIDRVVEILRAGETRNPPPNRKGTTP